MFALLLQGDFRGRALNVATANATAGVADGWAKDLTGRPYPFEASAVLPPSAPIPASYNTWKNAGYPPGPPLGTPVVQSGFSNISNTNPANLIFPDATASGRFIAGDVVRIDGTNSAQDGKYLTLGTKTGNTFAIPALDLSALGAPIGNGTATKV